uniref:Uncharacterized protein n=1 Tax=Ascaris lumbricoides TaxID=6252 RepID=A0A0M3I276_ASCLU
MDDDAQAGNLGARPIRRLRDACASLLFSSHNASVTVYRLLFAALFRPSSWFKTNELESCKPQPSRDFLHSKIA